jgi:hypothetical protein
MPVLMVCATLALVGRPASAQELELRLEIANLEAEENSPVFVALRLTNRSGRPLPLPPLALYGDWVAIEASADDGRRVDQGWTKAFFMQIGPFADTLEPGAEWTTAFLAQRHLFDGDGDFLRSGISRLSPGTYRLVARYLTWFPNAEPNNVNPLVAESPPVTPRIVPASALTRRRYQRVVAALGPLRERRVTDPVAHLLSEMQDIVAHDPANRWLLYLVSYGIPYAGGLTPQQDSVVARLRTQLFVQHQMIGAQAYLLEDLSVHRDPLNLLAGLPTETALSRRMVENRIRRLRQRELGQ